VRTQPHRYLLHGRVLTPVRDLASASVLVEDGRVAWLRPGLEPAARAEPLAEPGDIILPGFLDLQVNGYGGCDAGSGPEAIAAISGQLPATGVTGFLPTTVSRPLEDAVAFARATAQVAAPGALVLGAHIEGPFLNPRHRGAHEQRWILEPTPKRVDLILAAAPRLVTLAPELAGGLEAVSRLSRAGVVVSVGHTGATYEQTAAAIEAGARFATHLFNAMPPVHQRDPGAATALVLDRRVALGVIADGVHVASPLLDLVVRARAGAGVVLTTDQMAAAGMPPGRYQLGGQEVTSDGTTARTVDGALAGSVAAMDEMLRRMAEVAGLRRAVTMATAAPARLLRERALGRIDGGLPANLVVMDAELRVRATLVAGRLAYRRSE
jgi:N-acetylglucosamine-6-phosphate deacetylase